MPKIIKNVTDMEIDEISLVDRGANQHALVTIAKRADLEEDHMPDIKLFDDKGTELPEDVELEEGQVVYDDEGNAYEFTLEDLAEEAEQEETREMEPVGKRNPFDRPKPVVKSFSSTVLEELSKAYTDDDKNAIISKALGRVEELEKRYEETAEIAKAERTLRLEREYISKAQDYNVPVNPAELGPVLMRMAETMSFEDCSVIAKCLEAAGDLIFSEIGAQGGGDNQDVMSAVNAHAMEEIGKADAGAVTDVFDANPDVYDEYLRSR